MSSKETAVKLHIYFDEHLSEIHVEQKISTMLDEYEDGITFEVHEQKHTINGVEVFSWNDLEFLAQRKSFDEFKKEEEPLDNDDLYLERLANSDLLFLKDGTYVG